MQVGAVLPILRSLGCLDSGDVPTFLSRRLHRLRRSPQARVHCTVHIAAVVRACLGPGEEALPVVLEASRSSDSLIRNTATEALWRIQGSNDLRLVALLDQYRTGSDYFHATSLYAIKNGGRDFYPLLLKMAVDKSLEETRRAVALHQAAERVAVA